MTRTVLFVCPHGVAKSVIARAYFQHLADQGGLQVASVAAGIDPRTALIVYRGGTLALRVRSIGEGAALTVETDRDGRPSFRRRRDKRAASYGAASPVRQNQTADIGAANQQAQP